MKPLLCLLATIALAAPAFGTALTDIPFEIKEGQTATLEDYAGKVVLIVNVASKCGNTKQYPALEALYKKYGPEKFVILGFPANDFKGQEPGTNAEIQQFCTGTYGITFPILPKIHVKGPGQAPLYAALTGPDAAFPGDVQWNFGKFLVGKDGTVVARFEPATKPEDPAVVAAIETALK
jgi:glutathione peroxidase